MGEGSARGKMERVGSIFLAMFDLLVQIVARERRESME